MRLMYQSLTAKNAILKRTPLVAAFQAGVDTVCPSISWWNVYRSADFPMLTDITKKYFFVFSSEHEGWGSNWGQGDNLDLSDYIDGGRCFAWNPTKNSYESPRLIVFQGKLHFYTHPLEIPQVTYLYRLDGNSGSLSNITDGNNNTTGDWTEFPDVLEIEKPPETSTGYLSLREENGLLIGKHMLRGSSSPLGSLFQISTSVDGVNWVRGDDVVQEYNPSTSEVRDPNMRVDNVFNINGKDYLFSFWRVDGDYTDVRMQLGVANDSSLNNWKFIQDIKPVEHTGNSEFYYDADTLTVHCYSLPDYWDNDGNIIMYHSTIDVSNL